MVPAQTEVIMFMLTWAVSLQTQEYLIINICLGLCCVVAVWVGKTQIFCKRISRRRIFQKGWIHGSNELRQWIYCKCSGQTFWQARESWQFLWIGGDGGLVAKSCLTCDSMDCSLPGSSVRGILQASILQWVATSFSRGSSWPKNQTQFSCISGRFFTNWATREVLLWVSSQFL